MATEGGIPVGPGRAGGQARGSQRGCSGGEAKSRKNPRAKGEKRGTDRVRVSCGRVMEYPCPKYEMVLAVAVVVIVGFGTNKLGDRGWRMRRGKRDIKNICFT